ncbi:MAG: hypothetical protein R6W73_02315 [Candidatus Saliniplasma sp.]
MGSKRSIDMRMSYNTKDIMIISLVVAVVNLAIPYLFLRDRSDYWINFVFWTLLTLIVMFIGFLYVKDWSESE